jgi:hypothetical protein
VVDSVAARNENKLDEFMRMAMKERGCAGWMTWSGKDGSGK